MPLEVSRLADTRLAMFVAPPFAAFGMFVPCCGVANAGDGESGPCMPLRPEAVNPARRAFATDGAGAIVSLQWAPVAVGKVAMIVVAFACVLVSEKQKFPAAFSYQNVVSELGTLSGSIA